MWVCQIRLEINQFLSKRKMTRMLSPLHLPQQFFCLVSPWPVLGSVLRNAVDRKSGVAYIKDTVHGPAHMMQCLGPGARDKWAEEKL